MIVIANLLAVKETSNKGTLLSDRSISGYFTSSLSYYFSSSIYIYINAIF